LSGRGAGGQAGESPLEDLAGYEVTAQSWA
jgi:hypothetical protein